jgi:hypothetical protein
MSSQNQPLADRKKKRSHKRTASTKLDGGHFDEISCMAKSKLGELLLTVAEEELKIEKFRQ